MCGEIIGHLVTFLSVEMCEKKFLLSWYIQVYIEFNSLKYILVVSHMQVILDNCVNYVNNIISILQLYFIHKFYNCYITTVKICMYLLSKFLTNMIRWDTIRAHDPSGH